MDTLQLIQSIDEAIRIISTARTTGRLASGSSAIWRLSDHAESHLDKQIKELLAPPAENPAPPHGAHFVVYDDNDNSNHGTFDTIDEARGCAIFDHLTSWTIYFAGQIVEQVSAAAPAEYFYCRGCGREELVCSIDPCPDVIADRDATI